MPKQKDDKNIKYTNILLNQNSNNKDEPSTMEAIKFDQIVSMQNKNIEKNKNKTWSKLDKMSKIEKLKQYTDVYSEEHNLSSPRKNQLHKYLRECLDRRKLNRVKDVIYDKDSGEIKDIPGLSWNTNVLRFTFKSREKKDSTMKNLTRVKKRTKEKKNNKKKAKQSSDELIVEKI